ncbi:hypothetical protein [Amycolatopsis alkalitolerans]|uniref:hypothetical protein n=1 Tax=Amycolatopsis alkalitolerans TaxID=2547244 RepID=UPI001F1ABA48|nr:hypothetical protein [Amycolatopsis alkalitolerans]
MSRPQVSTTAGSSGCDSASSARCWAATTGVVVLTEDVSDAGDALANRVALGRSPGDGFGGGAGAFGLDASGAPGLVGVKGNAA